MSFPGVYSAKKTNGTIYYRSSITYKNKHISLGSFSTEQAAHEAYVTADQILSDEKSGSDETQSMCSHKRGSSIVSLAAPPLYEDYQALHTTLAFDKWIMLKNLKDNGIYCKNPIYLQHKHFLYYLNDNFILKFDTDDLFYYMNHKIMQRGGHLFVSDYGMQVNILTRYGIKNFAVNGRDYRFVNGDSNDFSYENIEIINRYHGVRRELKNGLERFAALIHIKGDYIIGRYSSEQEAAVAYNKAVAILKEKGCTKNFPENYIDALDHIAYAKLYSHVRISRKIREYIHL